MYCKQRIDFLKKNEKFFRKLKFNLYSRARAASFRVGGLERQTSKMSYLGDSGCMFPREILILTTPKCREMQLKLINEILKYKFSGLKLSDSFTHILIFPFTLVLLTLTLK